MTRHLGLRQAIRGARNKLLGRAEPSGQAPREVRRRYIAHVAALKTQLPHAEAMETAVGGQFELIGAIEAALVRRYGLPADGYLVDVGCGSGRLARPISAYLRGRYLGIDVVPDLVDYARRTVGRPDWRFEAIDHIGVPEADAQADVVCFFSVLTHLLHEQSYWYLEEAKRVLKPGGRIVFSFLEFREADHWPVFRDAVAGERAKTNTILNVFIERSAIEAWAERLEMDVEDLRGGNDAVVPEGHLGQSLCVLRKR